MRLLDQPRPGNVLSVPVGEEPEEHHVDRSWPSGDPVQALTNLSRGSTCPGRFVHLNGCFGTPPPLVGRRPVDEEASVRSAIADELRQVLNGLGTDT
jgi:hypothetical protein